MKFMLDTNICIFAINRRPPEVRARFENLAIGDVGISSVTVSELQYGIAKSAYPERNQAALAKFLSPLVVLSYGEEAAREYGIIRYHLEKQGKPIGSMDMMIAAHALALNLTLVTNNLSEFSRVPRLKVEDWTQS